VAWLRLPPAARDGKVAVLPTVEPHCSAASVNRKLAALISFCEFHARHGVALAGLLVTMQPAGRGGSAVSYYTTVLEFPGWPAASNCPDRAWRIAFSAAGTRDTP